MTIACAVCSGASDASVAPAINASIGLLLVVIAGVGGGFFRFLLYLARCDKLPEPSRQDNRPSERFL